MRYLLITIVLFIGTFTLYSVELLSVEQLNEFADSIRSKMVANDFTGICMMEKGMRNFITNTDQLYMKYESFDVLAKSFILINEYSKAKQCYSDITKILSVTQNTVYCKYWVIAKFKTIIANKKLSFEEKMKELERFRVSDFKNLNVTCYYEVLSYMLTGSKIRKQYFLDLFKDRVVSNDIKINFMIFLSIIEIDEENNDESMKYLKRAEKLIPTITNFRNILEMQLNLAKTLLYDRQQNIAESNKYLSKAIQIKSSISNLDSINIFSLMKFDNMIPYPDNVIRQLESIERRINEQKN